MPTSEVASSRCLGMKIVQRQYYKVREIWVEFSCNLSRVCCAQLKQSVKVYLIPPTFSCKLSHNKHLWCDNLHENVGGIKWP